METSIPPGNNAEARQKAFKGYPRGWFVVSFSDELKVGDVHTLNYFGKKYALYRGDDGVPRPPTLPMLPSGDEGGRRRAR